MFIYMCSYNWKEMFLNLLTYLVTVEYKYIKFIYMFNNNYKSTIISFFKYSGSLLIWS